MKRKFVIACLLIMSMTLTSVRADEVPATITIVNTTTDTVNIQKKPTVDDKELSPVEEENKTVDNENTDKVDNIEQEPKVIEQNEQSIDYLIENQPKVIEEKTPVKLETVNNYKIGIFKLYDEYTGKTYNFQANKAFTYNYKLPVPKLIVDEWSFNVFTKKIEEYFSDKNAKTVLAPQKMANSSKYKLVKQKSGQIKIDKEKFKADLMNRIRTADYSTVKIPVTTESKDLLDASKNEIIKLSQFTTYYDASNIGRTQNVIMAGKAIHGTRLEAGETFRYNSRIKSIYPYLKVAKVIVEDEYVDGVGGGLCQPSTTLFNTALEAGLTINVRNNHSKVSNYVAVGRDAMVSSWSDLVFTNNLKHPVYIMYYQTGGNGITFAMYGSKSDKVYPKIWVKYGGKGYILYRQIGKKVNTFYSRYK